MIDNVESLIDLLCMPLGDQCVTGEAWEFAHPGLRHSARVSIADGLWRVERDDFVDIGGSETYWHVKAGQLTRCWPRVDSAQNQPSPLIARRSPREYWEEWLFRDPKLVQATLTATSHLGRPALSFRTPTVKGGNPCIIADLATGIELLKCRDDVGVYAAWDSFSVSQLNMETFTYAGR